MMNNYRNASIVCFIGKNSLINYKQMDDGVLYQNRINSTISSHLIVDFSYRQISSKTKTCLIIQNNKKISHDNLESFFEDVYTLDLVKFRNLERKEFRDKDNKNQEVLISESFSLPYKDEFFDLVVYNGLELLEKKQIESFFYEIKRVLRQTGCFCVTAENKSILKKFDKNFNKNNRKFYSNSYNEYMKIFKRAGFKVKGNWIIGSLEKPYFIGNTDNEVGFKWLLSNFNEFFSQNPRSKNLISLINNFGFIFGKKLFEIVSPYFLFYCHKESLPNEFEILVERKTKFKNFIQQVRYNKIVFILLDENGRPRKRLLCKRDRVSLEKEVVVSESLPKPDTFKHDLVLVDWADGKTANFTNVRELELVLKWLLDFQCLTRNDIFEKQLVDDEINVIKDKLQKNNFLKTNKFEKWLLDYGKLFDGDVVKTTGVHGDFSPHNILIDMEQLKVNVIDWETYYSDGSPFYDIAKIIYHVLTPNSSVEEFRKNIKNMKWMKTIKIIDKLLSDNFQKKINLITVLRYYFLKDLACNNNVGKKYFSMLIDELSEID